VRSTDHPKDLLRSIAIGDGEPNLEWQRLDNLWDLDTMYRTFSIPTNSDTKNDLDDLLIQPFDGRLPSFISQLTEELPLDDGPDIFAVRSVDELGINLQAVAATNIPSNTKPVDSCSPSYPWPSMSVCHVLISIVNVSTLISK